MNTKRIKRYVQVTVDFYADGRMRPVLITWEDGRKLQSDKITDIRRAKSQNVGGTGIRYTCIIWGKRCYLFYEENYKWFVEARVAA